MNDHGPAWILAVSLTAIAAFTALQTAMQFMMMLGAMTQ